MRIALCIEYNGAGFCGWQVQPGKPTIQRSLEQALARIAGAPVDVVCAGRTDSGVHALAQIVHFDTTVERPTSAWSKGVNAHLPDSIAVLWAHPVDDDFHARFSATGRSYEYVLMNRPVRPAVGAGAIGWFHHRLDLDAMHAAGG